MENLPLTILHIYAQNLNLVLLQSASFIGIGSLLHVHSWEKCSFSRELNQNFLPTLLNYPPVLYVFLYFRGKINLQMSKFPGNQVPEFPIFSRHVHVSSDLDLSPVLTLRPYVAKLAQHFEKLAQQILWKRVKIKEPVFSIETIILVQEPLQFVTFCRIGSCSKTLKGTLLITYGLVVRNMLIHAGSFHNEPPAKLMLNAIHISWNHTAAATKLKQVRIPQYFECSSNAGLI